MLGKPVGLVTARATRGRGIDGAEVRLALWDSGEGLEKPSLSSDSEERSGMSGGIVDGMK